jgi:MFS family permease
MTTPVEEGGVGIDAGLVVLSFSLSSLTGPTAGVFFGGWYIDKHGGYKDETGQAAAATLKRCTVFGALALAFAIPAAFLTSFWPIQIAMWFVLFWGGALISPATGVCINAVSPELRAFSSALSMFSYNILGYSAAPFVCGLLAQQFSLRWGFRTVLLSSSVAFIGLAMAWRVAEEEFVARAGLAGQIRRKNPMRESYDSRQSADDGSGSRSSSPALSIELYSDSDSFDAEQQRSSSFDGEQQGPTSKGTISGRKSMRLSVKLPGGPSPRLSRQTSEL